MLLRIHFDEPHQVCLHFPFDFAILMREVLAGANTPSPYFLGRTTVSVLPSLPFLLMGLIPYFMTGLSSDYHAVLYFVLIIVLTNLAAQSLGYLSSSFSSNPIVGISIRKLIGAALLFLLCCFGSLGGLTCLLICA